MQIRKILVKKITNGLASIFSSQLFLPRLRLGRTSQMPTQSEIGYNSKIEGDVVVTTVDAALNWFRANSVWPMPMGLACCAIELMAVGASRFDISRFGSEVMRFSPRQADCMIVAGTVTYKMAGAVKRDLGSDGRAEMVHRHGRVRLDRRDVSQLRRAARRGSNHSRGRLCLRLSAAS